MSIAAGENNSRKTQRSARGTSSLKRDIVSAYLVTAARMLAWITVTATVYRVAGKLAFALLGIVESTVGILEYAAIGLSPAIIRLTAEAIQNHKAAPPADEGARAPEPFYNVPAIRAVYANGFAMAVLTAVGGGAFLGLFLFFFRNTQTNRGSHGVALELVLMVGLATLLRMMSDAPGAVLQTCGRIFLDNVLLTIHEAIWGVGTVINLYVFHLRWQRATGFALLTGSVVLLIARSLASHSTVKDLFKAWWTRVDPRMVRRLLIFGGMVVAAQMADYLYAPTDYLIILNLIDQATVAVYQPAVKIDGAALLLVTALATVLLPRTALAHASGNMETVRRYYILGTVSTGLVLLGAAPLVWWVAPHLLNLWLGDPMPATCAILPFMLIHTVIGGSSAVGRAILLAIGKIREFTISVLIAGIANVILSYAFVRYGHMGLRGIVLGTIVAVAGRCVFWLPWYTLRVLHEQTGMAKMGVTEMSPPAPLP
ncbi:MAG: MATE family efflux transporter [Planctomycetota bacterium]|nr:MATE family efflux transporter [Planctomycetota bacterium]